MPYGLNFTQNKEVIKTATDELKMNPVTDAIPQSVIPTIQPVFELNRMKTIIARSNTSGTSGATTVFTTPSDRDFYLTAVCLAYTADATADNTSTNMTAFVEGGAATTNILRIPKTTATAGNEFVTLTFPYPLKVNRNTAIAIQSSFTAGTSTRTGSIFGFTMETGDAV